MRTFSSYMDSKKNDRVLREVVLLARQTGFPIEEFVTWYLEEGYILPQREVDLLVEGWGGRVMGGLAGAATGAAAGFGIGGGFGAIPGAIAGGLYGARKGGTADKMGDSVSNWWKNRGTTPTPPGSPPTAVPPGSPPTAVPPGSPPAVPPGSPPATKSLEDQKSDLEAQIKNEPDMDKHSALLGALDKLNAQLATQNGKAVSDFKTDLSALPNEKPWKRTQI